MQHSALFVDYMARDQKKPAHHHWLYKLEESISLRAEDEKSNMHKASVINWVGFKATLVQGDVTEQLQAANINEIVECKEYLKHTAALTIFLRKQGIAFRGHNETKRVTVKGTFWSACCFLRDVILSSTHT